MSIKDLTERNNIPLYLHFLSLLFVRKKLLYTPMLARTFSSAVHGLSAIPIEVEIDISYQGMPKLIIVGLPDKAVEEATERVRSAIKNSDAEFPIRRITVNLAPADIPKEGPSYDLPIAVGILIASGQLQADTSKMMFMGELSLDGRVRSISGVLPQAVLAKELGINTLFVPKDNAKEAALIDELTIYPVETLKELLYHLSGQSYISPQPPTALTGATPPTYAYDMKDIKGQEHAKRALEIASAGGHNILMKGPPGSGKTLLARTLPSILPALTFDEMLDVTKIYSISGMLDNTNLLTIRPFRSPHHTTSYVGLIGGSANPKPGEISLAHRGVLFLDELPEFPRPVLEALRQPLEDGHISISRAQGRVSFPAKFLLIAAQNPCPCGYLGDPTHQCSCTSMQIQQYQKKISGPLLDRIDIHIAVPAVKIDKLTNNQPTTAETSDSIRTRVQKARDRQHERLLGRKIKTNAEMTTNDIRKFCQLDPESTDLMRAAVEKFHLSARSYYRVLKLARTIADLGQSEKIQTPHIAEALQYRPRLEK